MEAEVIEVMKSLDQRDQKFRDQVARLREFREKLRQSGSKVDGEGYSVPLMGRIEQPHENTVELFNLTHSD